MSETQTVTITEIVDDTPVERCVRARESTPYSMGGDGQPVISERVYDPQLGEGYRLGGYSTFKDHEGSEPVEEEGFMAWFDKNVLSWCRRAWNGFVDAMKTSVVVIIGGVAYTLYFVCALTGGAISICLTVGLGGAAMVSFFLSELFFFMPVTSGFFTTVAVGLGALIVAMWDKYTNLSRLR